MQDLLPGPSGPVPGRRNRASATSQPARTGLVLFLSWAGLGSFSACWRRLARRGSHGPRRGQSLLLGHSCQCGFMRDSVTQARAARCPRQGSGVLCLFVFSWASGGEGSLT